MNLTRIELWVCAKIRRNPSYCESVLFSIRTNNLEVGWTNPCPKSTTLLDFPHKTNNPNPSPIGNKFGLFLFGPSGENRTHGLLNPIVLHSRTHWSKQHTLYAISPIFEFVFSFYFVWCQDVSFLLWSNCGQTTPTNDFSSPAKLHRAISIFINRSCAFLFARIIYSEKTENFYSNLGILLLCPTWRKSFRKLPHCLSPHGR